MGDEASPDLLHEQTERLLDGCLGKIQPEHSDLSFHYMLSIQEAHKQSIYCVRFCEVPGYTDYFATCGANFGEICDIDIQIH